MENKPQELSLESIVTTAIAIPGVRVNRNSFLTECFKDEAVDIHSIIDEGPVNAGCSREMLKKLSNSLILKRTSESSIASFIAGLPGGFAMGVAIPADVLQFFAVALRLAQEISYIYGSEDFWKDGSVNTEIITGQFVLYCGVMFGASGAANGVRLLSSQLAKTALKKIPQQALTKTFWFPIIKQIGKAVGVKVTKSTFAAGVSKIVPIVGGVISGGITFASMLPMGKRLASTLDDAIFDYDDEEVQEDITVLESMGNDTKPQHKIGFSIQATINNVKDQIIDIGNRINKKQDKTENDAFEKIEKLAKLHEIGAITDEEFESKKSELLEQI